MLATLDDSTQRDRYRARLRFETAAVQCPTVIAASTPRAIALHLARSNA
jgi:hypothetical protein